MYVFFVAVHGTDRVLLPKRLWLAEKKSILNDSAKSEAAFLNSHAQKRASILNFFGI
jgi:hypothetical protein